MLASGFCGRKPYPSPACAAIAQGGFNLLEGSALEPSLLQLVAHVSAYRVILQRCVARPQDPRAGCIATTKGMPRLHVMGWCA